MKLTVLIENTVSTKGCKAEHGLSFLLEADGEKILIDAGQTDEVLRNMRRLKIDVTSISKVVLSHGHYDHAGGLPAFINICPNTPIYLSGLAMNQKLKNGRQIGIAQSIPATGKTIEIQESITKLTDNVFIVSNFDCLFPEDSAKDNFKVLINGKEIDDEFDDELAVVVHHGDSISIISGCSHNGPANIAETIRKRFNLPIRNFIGGFHTKDNLPAKREAIITDYFNKQACKVWTCHCTGIEAYSAFKHKMKDINYIGTGTSIEL